VAGLVVISANENADDRTSCQPPRPPACRCVGPLGPRKAWPEAPAHITSEGSRNPAQKPNDEAFLENEFLPIIGDGGLRFSLLWVHLQPQEVRSRGEGGALRFPLISPRAGEHHNRAPFPSRLGRVLPAIQVVHTGTSLRKTAQRLSFDSRAPLVAACWTSNSAPAEGGLIQCLNSRSSISFWYSWPW
jgi:hypothetical protein